VQLAQEQAAAEALLDFTQELPFPAMCDAIYLLLEGRPDFDEAEADKLCSRIMGIAWKRPRGMVA
jgi:hypothetical protein